MKKLLPVLSAVVLVAACTSRNEVRIDLDNAPAESIRIEVLGPQIFRVCAAPEGKVRSRESLAIVPQKRYTNFTVTRDSLVRIVTPEASVTVNPSGGDICFYDAEGNLLLGHGSMDFTPVEVEGRKAWSTHVSFPAAQFEAFYGLGQQQSGELDHRGHNEELFQYNTKISIPFVLSNRGYGLLFDHYSLSRWGNPAPYRQMGEVFDMHLTGSYTTADGVVLIQSEDSLYYENERAVRNLPGLPLNGAIVVYEGSITARETGDYHFIQYYAGFQRTMLGGEEVMSRRWRPAWNPNSFKFTAHLEAGVPTPIRIEWEPDGDVSYIGLRVAPLMDAAEQEALSFWSEFEPQMDFYFIGGGSADKVISGYRRLSGKSPVVPRWALGFWQSRERYSSQDELLAALTELRARGIPVDNIVQDWQYWESDQWGSHEFDPARFPDPEAMLDSVHALHGRFMISVWPKFYTNTEHYKELRAAGFAYTHAEDSALVDWLGHRESFYDAYSRKGREMFWRQIDESLYTRYGRKIDAWWMDASEPNLRDCLPMDYQKWLTTPTALGPSTEYLNAYALVNADAIYNGQRYPDKRVFLLTRNGFAGLQRYSTASWSGDIGTSWTDMRTQMAAGLNYCMSGIPVWGMDIGGFSVMGKFYDSANLDEWRELQTRWHQMGAFVPLFRTHGQWPQRELWNIAPEGSPAYESILWYMQLRYRLMPYIYSLAGAVHFDDYTIMRALPMDYPSDPEVRDLSDQWMFGPAFMACPVYEYGERSRSVYFPMGLWYDFYTGSSMAGGKRFDVNAPFDRMPLWVRAGAIVPVGPAMQWSDEKQADDILLMVYAGADGSFTLYEDDGVSYGYERGEFARIRIEWDDAEGTLRIGEREGSFPGMLAERSFRVVLCSPDSPAGYDPDAAGNVVLHYDGSPVEAKF